MGRIRLALIAGGVSGEREVSLKGAAEVEKALDYKLVTKQVIAHVESGRFLLLEKLVFALKRLVETAFG